MNNNKMFVKCIVESEDGLSKMKLYEVCVVRVDSKGSLIYYLKDDNEQYNEYNSKFFEIVECYIEL